MKFRVKHIKGIGYFAQMKPWIFGGWFKIGKHRDGFGLYSKNDHDCPLECLGDAMERIKEFKQWEKLRKTKPTYRYVD